MTEVKSKLGPLDSRGRTGQEKDAQQQPRWAELERARLVGGGGVYLW